MLAETFTLSTCIKLFHGRKKQDDKLKLLPEIRKVDKSDLWMTGRLISKLWMHF